MNLLKKFYENCDTTTQKIIWKLLCNIIDSF